MMIPKNPPARAPAYLRWVATLPCMSCGIHGYTQAAHPNFGRGLGQKASDLDAFPLCCVRPGHIGCHQMHDLMLDCTREQRRAMELAYTASTQALAREAGRTEQFQWAGLPVGLLAGEQTGPVGPAHPTQDGS